VQTLSLRPPLLATAIGNPTSSLRHEACHITHSTSAAPAPVETKVEMHQTMQREARVSGQPPHAEKRGCGRRRQRHVIRSRRASHPTVVIHNFRAAGACQQLPASSITCTPTHSSVVKVIIIGDTQPLRARVDAGVEDLAAR
jgi:hypothetical protein